MHIKKPATKFVSLAAAIILLFQVMGCGTLIYPERRGQTGGRIDAGVAILDGVGLLLFVIPGIIAFGVDFATGAIYLPSKSTKADNPKTKRDLAVIKVNPDDISLELLEEILEKQTGDKLDLNADNVRVYRMGRQHGNIKVQLSMLVL